MRVVSIAQQRSERWRAVRAKSATLADLPSAPLPPDPMVLEQDEASALFHRALQAAARKRLRSDMADPYLAVDLGWLSSTLTANLPSWMAFSFARTLVTMSAGIFFSKVPSGASSEPLNFMVE